MKHNGVKEVCSVEAMLEPTDMKRKNQRWYQLKQEYNLAEFDVRVLADVGLRFEILSKDGGRRGEGDVEVRWKSGEGTDK